MSNLYAPEVKVENDNVILAIKMQRDFRNQWREHCAKHNLDMSVVIRRLMEAELAKAKAEEA